MATDIERAKALLREGGYTCAMVFGEKTITSRERGVKPLISLLDAGESLAEYSAADKVIGRAAAYLYLLLGVRKIFVGVISEGALAVLSEAGVSVEYEILTERIKNRAGTGFCPMESCVEGAESPEQALSMIRKSLENMAF